MCLGYDIATADMKHSYKVPHAFCCANFVAYAFGGDLFKWTLVDVTYCDDDRMIIC